MDMSNVTTVREMTIRELAEAELRTELREKNRNRARQVHAQIVSLAA
jgi:hypothetical protein